MTRARPPKRDAFVEEVLDLLAPLEASARAMFGGHGVSARGVFLGMIHAGRLYLRVDDATRARYERAGMGPFQVSDFVAKNYYEVPPHILADPRKIVRWANDAADAAAEVRARRAGKSGGSARRARATRVARVSRSKGPRTLRRRG